MEDRPKAEFTFEATKNGFEVSEKTICPPEFFF